MEKGAMMGLKMDHMVERMKQIYHRPRGAELIVLATGRIAGIEW
jgi:hypothetical protein